MTTLHWTERAAPLPAAGVVGRGSVAEQLRAAAISRPERLRAAGDSNWLLLLGELTSLPWADGAVYLGWEGGLLTPTLLAPSVPADLLRRAFEARPDELVAIVPGAVLRTPTPIRAADLRLGSDR